MYACHGCGKSIDSLNANQFKNEKRGYNIYCQPDCPGKRSIKYKSRIDTKETSMTPNCNHKGFDIRSIRFSSGTLDKVKKHVSKLEYRMSVNSWVEYAIHKTLKIDNLKDNNDG